MISTAHYERVLAALEDIRKDGLTVAVGGKAIEGPGCFIEPTVVTDVPAAVAIAGTEIFGPVVSEGTFVTGGKMCGCRKIPPCSIPDQQSG